jgi:hypothetical protein
MKSYRSGTLLEGFMKITVLVKSFLCPSIYESRLILDPDLGPPKNSGRVHLVNFGLNR